MATPPPSQTDLLALFERITPSEFHAPMQGHPSLALIRGMAEVFAQLATKASRTQQAAFFLPHALQTFPPASSGVRATGTTTLRREADTTGALLAEPGEMRLEGRGGRAYVNTSTIFWYPQSTGVEQFTGTFQCEITGFAGNLDHLADTNGELPLDRIDMADQSQGRASTGGSILIGGTGTAIQDSGTPDLFAPEDVGLYVKINQASNASNEGRRLKIVGFDFPAEEIPVGAGLYPRRVFVETNELSVAREALREDNSTASFVDVTASVLTRDADVVFFPDPSGLDDAFLVASSHPLAGVRFSLSTAAVADWTLTWEYENGSGFQALPGVTGLGAALDVEGAIEVTWDVPADFAAVASPATGLPWYFVRVRISAFTSVATAPVFRNLNAVDHRPLIAEAGTVTWALEDFKDLGVGIVSSQAFGGGRDDDLRLLGESRGLYQQDNETDGLFRSRVSEMLDTVSPNAVLRAVNRALRPFGAEGRAIDVQNGLTGAFADQDFFDNYTAGDTDFAHFAVRLVATTDVPLAVIGTPVVDGVATVNGDLILLTGQTNPVENGAYRVVILGVPLRTPLWGFGAATTALNGITSVSEGVAFEDTTWIVNLGDIIDTDALTIQQLITDAFPVDPNILNLSQDEAYGFFLVQVPFLGFGEFGAAFDEGPTSFIDAESTYVSGFMDAGFMDGGPSDSLALYAAIHSSVDAIRAGGINFVVVRDEAINNLVAC